MENLSRFKSITPETVDRLGQDLHRAMFLTFLDALPPLAPHMCYQLAGCPYGNNTRGKKRWLLEMKRKGRATGSTELSGPDSPA